MASLLIKYPSRSRPKEFLFALRKYGELLSGKHDVRFCISADEDDKSMQTTEFIKELESLQADHTIGIFYGNNKSKIEACNADIDKYMGEWFPWDVVLLASDDMIPQEQGYDDIILTEMLSRFPDTDGALFFSDGTGCFTSNLCTITIFGRKYYERFGYLYHPDYKSYFCDNEQTEVGQMLGKMAKIDRVIIKNEHPVHKDLTTGQNGTFPKDALYKRNDAFWKHDERLYKQRKAANFGLSPLNRAVPMDFSSLQIVDSSFTKANADIPPSGMLGADVPQPLLSILIPTIPERKEKFDFLWNELQSQIQGLPVELIADHTPKHVISIGKKRQSLYAQAKGVYSVQIDDDDGVPTFYIQKILEALESRPDCVTYLELAIMDGEPKTSCHSNRFPDWRDNYEGYQYVRTPFFKDVIKTEICRKIKVRDLRFGEDHQWSKELKRSELIKYEVHVSEYLYFYSHVTLNRQEHRERYGL